MSDDVDVDALCAELDDIIDKPTAAGKSKPAAKSQLSQYSQSKPSSSAAAPSYSPNYSNHASSTSNTRTTTKPSTTNFDEDSFDLNDSDEDDAPRNKKKGPPVPPKPAFSLQQQSQQQPQQQQKSSATNNKAANTGTTAAAGSGFDSDDDLNSLLADMDSAIDKKVPQSTKLNLKPAPVTHNTSTASTFHSSSSNNTSSSASSKQKHKCLPILLTNGTSARGCDNLLCVNCDLPVVSFPNHRWKAEVVDYLFFRNHYPDYHKFAKDKGIAETLGTTAYCCQCSWQSIGTSSIGDVKLDLTNLDRSDKSNKNGCSTWANLKWVCMGHQ